MKNWEEVVRAFERLDGAAQAKSWSQFSAGQRAAFAAAATTLGLAIPERWKDRWELASLSSRLGAQVLDGVVVALPMVCAALLWETTLPAVNVFLWLLGLGYFGLADALPGGQSLGKRAFGIAAIDALSGAPCSVRQSIWRNAAQLMGLLDWAWIFRDNRQRMGDQVARTCVVDVRHPRSLAPVEGR